VNDPNRKKDDTHLGASHDVVVRIVLAEVDAPGPLQYLLESEGFLVVGCASDEEELARVLQPGLDPDVVVLDTDVSVTSVLIARERAPSAHVIVLWPEGVQHLPGTERIAPWLMYEQLGPAIRRAAHERPQRHAGPDAVTQELTSITDGSTQAAEASLGHAASRLWVAPLVLISMLVVTMGAAIALDSLHVRLPWAEPRTGQTAHQAPSPNATAATPGVRPNSDSDTTKTGSCRHTKHARPCRGRDGASDGKPAHPGRSNHPNKPDHPAKPDHPVKPDHPGKDGHRGGKPEGAVHGGSSDSGSTEPGSSPGPTSPPGNANHGSR